MDPKLEGVSMENIFLSEKNNGSGYCFCSANFYHSSLLFQWGMGLSFKSVLFTQGRTVSHLSLVTPVTGPSLDHSTKSDVVSPWWKQYEKTGGVRFLPGFLCVPHSRLIRMCLGTWQHAPWWSCSPETRIITQRLYILEALNGILTARKCPSYVVNIFGFIWKIMVPEDPHSLSISAMCCCLGRPRGC